jgi:hypothetical protein
MRVCVSEREKGGLAFLYPVMMRVFPFSIVVAVPDPSPGASDFFRELISLFGVSCDFCFCISLICLFRAGCVAL